MAGALATLKTRADFLRVAAGRVRAVRPGLILQAAARPAREGGQDGGAGAVRVGFTASRKVGNSVVRNRAKRRLRAAAAEILARQGRPGTDYVLVARGDTGARPYGALLADLKGALRQIERPRAGPPRDQRDRGERDDGGSGRPAPQRSEKE